LKACFPITLTVIAQRRAKSAGIVTRVGNHTFRATGVTAYLKNGGTLETPAQDGWCAEIAIWAEHRPNVSVWFDKWLETPERHFWFGFEGPKAKMEALYELKASYGNGKVPVIYNNYRFENSRGSAFDIVKANAGFVYEKYRGERYYLGTYSTRKPPRRRSATRAPISATRCCATVRARRLSISLR
jgi:hypothetical protein